MAHDVTARVLSDRYLDLVEMHELRGPDDLARIRVSNVVALRRSVELGFLAAGLPRDVKGMCGCCGEVRDIELSTRHSELTRDGGLKVAFSETCVCRVCKINSRMRFACDILFSGLDSSEPVYLTERKTNLFAALVRSGRSVTGSEYLGPDKECGKEYDGVVHQDVHRLTFPDETFSGVLCLDVLEHVNDPLVAMVELFRVIRRGGLGVITIPFFDRPESVVRAKLNGVGEIECVLAPEYHGNPSGGRSLVFRELGWDFVDAVRRELGAERVSFVSYWSLYRMHLGPSRFAFILRR